MSAEIVDLRTADAIPPMAEPAPEVIPLEGIHPLVATAASLFMFLAGLIIGALVV